MTDRRPATRTGTLSAALTDPQVPGKLGNAVSDLRGAWTAVQRLHGDVDATLQTAVVCTGTSWAEATAAVAEFTAGAGPVEIHAMASARVPGPVADTWAYQVTLYVTYVDARDEGAAVGHHATDAGERGVSGARAGDGRAPRIPRGRAPLRCYRLGPAAAYSTVPVTSRASAVAVDGAVSGGKISQPATCPAVLLGIGTT